jgi:hypothetical protein
LHVCVCDYSVCAVLCVGSGLETGWSPSKEYYRLCKKDHETEEEIRAQQRAVEPLVNEWIPSLKPLGQNWMHRRASGVPLKHGVGSWQGCEYIWRGKEFHHYWSCIILIRICMSRILKRQNSS